MYRLIPKRTLRNSMETCYPISYPERVANSPEAVLGGPYLKVLSNAEAGILSETADFAVLKVPVILIPEEMAQVDHCKTAWNICTIDEIF